jgi:hypothetical protein
MGSGFVMVRVTPGAPAHRLTIQVLAGEWEVAIPSKAHDPLKGIRATCIHLVPRLATRPRSETEAPHSAIGLRHGPLRETTNAGRCRRPRDAFRRRAVVVIDMAGGPDRTAGFRPSDRISDVPTSRNASRYETERNG